MKLSKVLITAAVFGLFLTAGALSTYAFRGGGGGKGGPNFDSEKNQAIQESLENGDYNTWKELVADTPMANENITEENFARFAEMHKLMQEGNREEAEALREELGLPEKGGFGPKMRKMGNMRFEDKNGDGFCDYQDIEDTEEL